MEYSNTSKYIRNIKKKKHTGKKLHNYNFGSPRGNHWKKANKIRKKKNNISNRKVIKKICLDNKFIF